VAKTHGIIADVDTKADLATKYEKLSDGATLDHLGIAVASIAAARGFYELLGIVVGPEETIEHEQVRVAMLSPGGSRIELLEATAEDSVIGRFVAKRGEGLHHVALRVADVDATFLRLRGDGIRLASEAVRTGAGGHRYFFVHPSSTGGVLVEIVGDAK
jgi:LAO/AO transport system kinase